jgi:putative DNA primase/helicase
VLPTRFVLLRIKESFMGREDVNLKEKLQPELPGILNWALDGLDQFRDRGKFVMPKSSRDDIRQLQELASPVGTFKKDWCVTGPGERINVKELYAAYQAWSEEAGQRPRTRAVFGRELHSVLPRIRIKGRGIARTYIGIALSDEGQEQLDEIRHAKERR